MIAEQNNQKPVHSLLLSLYQHLNIEQDQLTAYRMYTISYCLIEIPYKVIDTLNVRLVRTVSLDLHVGL